MLKFRTPPVVLNQTDIYEVAKGFLSWNRQRWYEIPFSWTHYDSSKIHWGDAIAIANIQQSEFVLTSNAKHSSRTTGNQLITSMQEVPVDLDKFFLIREPLPVVPSLKSTSAHQSHGMIAHAAFRHTGRVTNTMTEGLPTLCNSTIRLLHALTQKYLSSTFFRTPDSQEQEVYANGENNVGDTDDNWIVECEPNTRHGYSWRWDWIANKYALFKYDHTLHKNRAQFVLDTNNNYWRPSTVVRFFHPNSNKYLTFNKVDITARVCPLCYRNKHKEISSTLYDTKGDSQRFHVKRQTRALIECSKTRDLLPKRWRMANRVLHTGDYVVWRNTSMNPCDVTGPHPVNHVDWMPDTRFGKVLRFFEESSVVHVEEYWERSNVFSAKTRHYTSTPMREEHVLDITTVHGPLYTLYEQPTSHASSRTWVKAYFDDAADYMPTLFPN